MPRHTSCIKELKNREKIIEIEGSIAQSEIQLDKVNSKKKTLKKSINTKKRKISYLEEKTPADSSEIQKLHHDEVEIEKKIQLLNQEEVQINSTLFKLQELLKDELKMGLVDLYHQTKSEYENAHNNYMVSQEHLIKANENLNKNTSKNSKNYDNIYNDWLLRQERLFEAKQLLKNKKEKLNTIKHFIRIEWEC